MYVYVFQFAFRIVILGHNKNIEQDLQEKLLWNRLPLELKKKVSATKRSTSDSSSNKSRKKKKISDPDQIFAKLESKESKGSDDEDEKGMCNFIYLPTIVTKIIIQFILFFLYICIWLSEEEKKEDSDEEGMKIVDGDEEEVDPDEEMDEGTKLDINELFLC